MNIPRQKIYTTNFSFYLYCDIKKAGLKAQNMCSIDFEYSKIKIRILQHDMQFYVTLQSKEAMYDSI